MLGSDYDTPAPSTLSFSSSAQTLSVSVLIIDDDVCEDTQTFNVSLTLGDSSINGGGVVIYGQTVEISIVDNEGEYYSVYPL